MRRRGKNTKTLENTSGEVFKGSPSKLLPDSTRRPRRYIWSQLFPLGHSDLLIINLRLRVSVGFSPTSPKRKQKLQPNFGCVTNLAAIQIVIGNTLLASATTKSLGEWGCLVCVSKFAFSRTTRQAVAIGRYKEVQLFGNPGCWGGPDQPTKSSVKPVSLQAQ